VFTVARLAVICTKSGKEHTYILFYPKNMLSDGLLIVLLKKRLLCNVVLKRMCGVKLIIIFMNGLVVSSTNKSLT
jgi:hypothetical protein